LIDKVSTSGPDVPFVQHVEVVSGGGWCVLSGAVRVLQGAEFLLAESFPNDKVPIQKSIRLAYGLIKSDGIILLGELEDVENEFLHFYAVGGFGGEGFAVFVDGGDLLFGDVMHQGMLLVAVKIFFFLGKNSQKIDVSC
jgi:hypothetical protein